MSEKNVANERTLRILLKVSRKSIESKNPFLEEIL